MTVVALLTYTSNDEDVMKGSDRKKSKIQTHGGSLGTSITTGCGGGKKEELSDTHISGLDNQQGVAHHMEDHPSTFPQNWDHRTI